MGRGRLGAAAGRVIAQRFAGRADWQQRLTEALTWGCSQGVRDWHAWDASFADWPLSDPDLLAVLTAWARPGRRLHLLAQQYDELVRRHPRFVRWRRDYAHCVVARAVDPDVRLEGAPECLLLGRSVDARLSLRLLDRHLWRGDVSLDAGECQRGLEWFDAVAQRSGESFAPTTLGL